MHTFTSQKALLHALFAFEIVKSLQCILNDEEIVETFYEKELQKTN